MSDKKQSSVELFIEQLEEMGDLRDCESLGLIQFNIDKNEYLALKEQAKAIHKEEIKDAFYYGLIDDSMITDNPSEESELYYNETFNQ